MLDVLLHWAAWIALLWIGTGLAVALVYRRLFVALWDEPVFRCPVLVLESDDWGAGPLTQASALGEIAALLEGHRDGSGHPAVLSLAVVLAVPDGDVIRRTERYARIDLEDARLLPVLEALREGRSRGTLALQLHGMEHYWPQALMASTNEAVLAWLRSPAPSATEQLPAHLQSRWVNASRLPSTPHDSRSIEAAVEDEVRTYIRIFGDAPGVVVPPTFVWTREVERAWSRCGVRCVVTPGWRYTMRDADGAAAGDEGPIANGDRQGDLVYTARSDYFEPIRQRDARHALRALALATDQGRPCVLENHRDNFLVDDPRQRAHHLGELDALCRGALSTHPGLRFLSTAELARVLRDRDPSWLATEWRQRLPAAWARVRATGRVWKLARLSSVAAIGHLIVRALGRWPADHTLTAPR